MQTNLILASASTARAQLLKNAGLVPEIVPARIDEETIRQALLTEQFSPRDTADALADAKARKVSSRHPGSLVLGCDQIAAIGQDILTKPQTEQDARAQLTRLSSQSHHLYSAAVLYHQTAPIWRFVGEVTLTFHHLSSDFIASYVARNWESIRHSVGAYKLEEEGVRLVSRLQGDYFHVLGLPLIELMSYLIQRGELDI